MPLTIKSGSDGIKNVYESNMLKPILRSSIKSAILITVIVMFIVFINIPNDDFFKVRMFKMGFYIFSVVIIISSLNRTILKNEFEESTDTRDIDNIAGSAQSSMYSGGMDVNVLSGPSNMRHNNYESMNSLSLSEILNRSKSIN
jgi:hypothetical protein